MKYKIKITTGKTEDGEVIIVRSPYNERFVKKARNLKGTWGMGLGAWWFAKETKPHVKQALKDVYGVDGTHPYKVCKLRIKDITETGHRSAVSRFGWTLAKAWGRDSGAKLGDDVLLLQGKISSGGSVKNWRTIVRNSTFEIQNFPVLRTEFDDIQKAIEEGWCEIIEQDDDDADNPLADFTIEELKEELQRRER